jgi:outer membrane protein assembly factor BamE (lipoprotein component of BamABCDE complex)
VRHGLRRGIALVLSWALLAAAAGCGTPNKDLDPNISSLRLGMSREEVRTVMGTPRAVETVGHVEFWLYSIDSPENATQDIAGPERDAGRVGFVNGRVTGWGGSYYNDAFKGVITADGSAARKR